METNRELLRCYGNKQRAPSVAMETNRELPRCHGNEQRTPPFLWKQTELPPLSWKQTESSPVFMETNRELRAKTMINILRYWVEFVQHIIFIIIIIPV